MKRLVVILFIGGIIFSSCKKKDDPKPEPSANKDNIDMGTTGVVTIDVLTNDSYTGNASVSITNNFTYGTLVVNSDKTVTFTSRINFYGTATLNYTVQDDNGSSTGNIIIKRGTDAQIKTYEIISSFNTALLCYAINGDSSRIYEPGYTNYGIDYIGFSTDKFIIHTANVVIPEIGYNNYSILSDGSIYTLANNTSNPVILQVVNYFNASAKKRDGSGQYMNVSGYTLIYGTDVLDFTTRID